MEKTRLKIEGMTCGHCVRGVTQALTDIQGVVSANVDLDKGVAEIQHDESVTDASLISAVMEEGYKATSEN